MLLHRLLLNPYSKEVRRDIAWPYEMHSTLCRAFSPADIRCPSSQFLWRLEPAKDTHNTPCVLVQSKHEANWLRLGVSNWLLDEPKPPIDIQKKFLLTSVAEGKRFRFRLRANPCVTKNDKRRGLLQQSEQEAWLLRKGREQWGFRIVKTPSFDFADVKEERLELYISQQEMIKVKKHNTIPDFFVFSVLYDGILEVIDAQAFQKSILEGVGHGKAFGLGLLSVVPLR